VGLFYGASAPITGRYYPIRPFTHKLELLIVFIGAIMNTNLKQLWQDRHRGRLHDPSSWDQCEKISLTYVSSSAGATGWTQLARFCALFPASQHPFSAEQLTRYNNQYEVINCMVDESTGTVTEEIVLSALHQDRLDYLLPGVEAQHVTYVLPFVCNAS
jgi:hypothetical protein